MACERVPERQRFWPRLVWIGRIAQRCRASQATRMPASAIFENMEAGANLDGFMEWFDGLNREQVKAVIEFAARSLDQPPVLSNR